MLRCKLDHIGELLWMHLTISHFIFAYRTYNVSKEKVWQDRKMAFVIKYFIIFFHLNIYFCMCAYIYEITCLWNIYFFFKKSSTKRYIKQKIFVLELFQSLTYKLFEVSINYCLWTCPKLQESFSQTHTLQRSNPSRITASTNANSALGFMGPYLCSIWHEFSTPWTQEFVQKHTGEKKSPVKWFHIRIATASLDSVILLMGTY